MKIPQEIKDKLSRWFSKKDMEPVRIILISWLPMMAITFGRFVFIRKSLFDTTPRFLGIMGHELWHVGQYKKRGFFTFLTQYIPEMFYKRPRKQTLEIPAYDMGRKIKRHYA